MLVTRERSRAVLIDRDTSTHGRREELAECGNGREGFLGLARSVQAVLGSGPVAVAQGQGQRLRGGEQTGAAAGRFGEANSAFELLVFQAFLGGARAGSSMKGAVGHVAAPCTIQATVAVPSRTARRFQ